MRDTPLVIREFEPVDLPKLQDIRAIAFAPVFASFRAILGTPVASVALENAENEQAEHLEAICAPDAPQQVYVGLNDGDIVGFVSVTLDRKSLVGELGLNAVHPDYCGRGFGTQLYKHALNRMREANMKVAVVGTGSDSSHAPARRAYEKVGFGPTLPNQWMYRTL